LVVAMLDSGQMTDVHTTLKEIHDTVPFAMLALLVASEIGEGLEKLPDDASNVISQLAYLPDSESFLGAMHFELALISRCISEYSKAKLDDDQATLKALRAHGSWAVGRIAEHLRLAGAK
jgi:hypothetical protein